MSADALIDAFALSQIAKGALLEAQLDSSLDGILVVDTQGGLILQNQRCGDLFQLPSGNVASDDDAQLRALVSRTRSPGALLARIRGLCTQPDETSRDEIELADGAVLDCYSAPVRGKDRRHLGRIWTFRDITDRKRAETALRESRAFYHSLVEQLPAGVFRKDPAGRYVYVSPWFCRLKGLPEGAFIGRTSVEVAVLEAAKSTRPQQVIDYASAGSDHHAEIMRTGRAFEVVEHYAGPAQRIQYVRVVRFPVFNECGVIIATQGVVFDITAHRQAEEQVRHLAAFPELNPNPVLELSEEGRVIYHNPAALAMARQVGFGRLEQLLPPETRTVVAECLAGGQPRLRLETVHERTTLSWSFYPITAHRVVHCYVGDITERLSLEAQLRQAQKLEAIGQLAGGVAHDFNNLLTAIIGNLGLLRGLPHLAPEMTGPLGEISAAAQRAANLTRQLLAFSRRQVMSVTDLDLNQVVAQLTKMLHRVLGEHVVMQVAQAAGQLAFRGDSGQIEQVLVNLAVNARDAMPEGGVLRIETAAENRAPPATTNGAPAESELMPCVRLSVSDTGTGIAPEHRQRIFEPFFTTKEVGKGTGLGLAMVFGIVQQHRGWIEMDSEVGRGTSFRIYFPRIESAVPVVAPVAPVPLARGRGELVLLVEDEAAVRETLRQALVRQGYRVVTAANGQEALTTWLLHRYEIALLLTDVVMPGGMSGLRLARELVAGQPALKVIYTSGYSAEFAGTEPALQPGVNYLGKPYECDQLFQMVRAVLDQPHPTLS